MRRNLSFQMLAAVGATLGLTWCALIRPTSPPVSTKSEKPPDKPFAFDLVPRGYDDNGLGRNPRWGGECLRELEDPMTCSWRFLEGGGHPLAQRPLCNFRPVDPDVSTFEATKWTITCSDSPINYTGHVNWGEYYGDASTFEGALSWDEYSGGMPSGDYDYNFLLTLPEDETLGVQARLIGVEFDSREVEQFGSEWWRDFRVKVHVFPNDVKEFLGTAEPAVVTGLLGLDAEHTSSQALRVEIHPAYAMAFRVPCGPPGNCTRDTWEIALFARAYGNEGLCSHWKRPHVLRLPEGPYQFRLPWKCGAGKVDLAKKGTRFCSNKHGAKVVINYDEKHRDRGVLVAVHIPPGGTVDGQMYLHWTDVNEGTRCAREGIFFNESEGGEVSEGRVPEREPTRKEKAARSFRRRPSHTAKDAEELTNKVLEKSVCIPVAMEGPHTPKERPPRIAECGQLHLKPMSDERSVALAHMDGGVVVPAEIPASTPEQKYCSDNESKTQRTSQFCSTIAP